MPTRQTGAAGGNFSGESKTAFGFWVTMGLFFSVIVIGLVGLQKKRMPSEASWTVFDSYITPRAAKAA
jgi:hypothetical protein